MVTVSLYNIQTNTYNANLFNFTTALTPASLASGGTNIVYLGVANSLYNITLLVNDLLDVLQIGIISGSIQKIFFNNTPNAQDQILGLWKMENKFNTLNFTSFCHF